LNQRSQAMNNVYIGNTVLTDDSFISKYASHVRAFQHHEKDYPAGETPASMGAAGPTEISGQFKGTIIKQYKVWKENWANRCLDIEIISALANAAPVGNNPNSFPGKWWLTEQWGANNQEIYDNAFVYGKAYAETACPPGEDCYVDILEVGNEPWGYDDPETYKQIYRGVVDGVASHFSGIPFEDWPMKVMPAAFQAFRAEGVSPVGTQLIQDYLGRRLPSDRKDKMYGIGVHPYGFVNDTVAIRRWQYNMFTGLNKEPEHPFSLFQFVKNGVYWRNVNIPEQVNGEYKTKVFASEFGYGSEDFTNEGCIFFPGVGELTQGVYNLRCMLMLGRLGVYRASLYESWDHNDQGYYGYGLYREGGGADGQGPTTRKSHYNTLKNFKDALGTKRFLRAIHDGELVNGTKLYAYVLGNDAGNAEYLVAWSGEGMDYAIDAAEVNAQRAALTAPGAGIPVQINLSNEIANTGDAMWLHDIPSVTYTGASVSGRKLPKSLLALWWTCF